MQVCQVANKDGIHPVKSDAAPARLEQREYSLEVCEVHLNVLFPLSISSVKETVLMTGRIL